MKKSKKRTSEQVVALAVSHLFVLPTNKRNKRILLPDNIIISLPRKKEKIKEEERIKRTNEKKINSSRTGESKEENLQASSCVRRRHALTREREMEKG